MYKSGYSLRIYQILENDLINFLNYIPLDYYFGNKRKEIFSPKLSELLIRIGSQVDIFFRNWDIVHDVYKQVNNVQIVNLKKLDIEKYRDIERVGKIILSDKEIKILSTNEIVTPFEYWTDKRYPLWWNAYNKVKHDGFANKEKGNLINVVESLAALFLLNCINKDTKDKLIKYGFRDVSSHEAIQLSAQKVWIIPMSPYIISQLFVFKEELII